MQLAKIQNGKVVLQSETLKKLKEIGKGIKVVALFGGARSAKSTTANMLLGKPSFQNSNTTDACTFGVWVDTALQKDGSVLMVVDSEGMGKGDTSQHPKILSLVSLLASDGGALIDNEMKDFVEHNLGTLGVLATMNQILRGAQEHNWPALFVLVRDFTLKLTVGRRPATPTQYLNHVLENPKEQDDSTRKLIKECFVIRHMFTLPPPTEQELLSMLNLPPGLFKEAFDIFKRELLECLLCKKISSVDCDGAMLVEFLSYFVDALNQGEGIDIPNAHEVVVERRCRSISAQLVAKYAEDIPKESLTGDERQLKEEHTKVLEELLAFYDTSTAGFESSHVEQIKKELTTQIGAAYALLEAENKLIMERQKNEELEQQRFEQQSQQKRLVEEPYLDKPITRTDLPMRRDTAEHLNQLHNRLSLLEQKDGHPHIYGQPTGFPFSGAQYVPQSQYVPQQQQQQPNIVMVTVNNVTPTPTPPSSPLPQPIIPSNGTANNKKNNNNNNNTQSLATSMQQSFQQFDKVRAGRPRSRSPSPRGSNALQASDVHKFEGHRAGRK